MPHHRSVSDDKSSMESIYNSAERFSWQNTCSLRSTCSSPTQSCNQDPAELPFRGKPQSLAIEEEQEILPSPIVDPNSEGFGQSVAVNFGSTGALQHTAALPELNGSIELDKLGQSHCPTPASTTSATNWKLLHLDTVGRMFDEPHDSSKRESELSNSSDDSGDEDFDLEKDADKFLSDKFGMRLSKLRRPDRIVDAFHHVKNKCVSILEDEGHHLVGSQCSEESQDELVDGEDNCHSTRGDFSSITGTPFTPGGVKRPNNDAVEAEGLLGSGSLLKTRRPKKRRMGGDLSCPYRKRNPRRFNVRDHEECANRSYKDISMLKKHITACHFKELARVCERCNQNYRAQDALVAHLERCPYPPPNRPPIRYTDPEDGIDYKTESLLKSRKSIDQISDWEALWRCLFPTDKEVPPRSDFEPVVEDHDIVFNYKCTQPQISQHLDKIFQGGSSKKIKELFFEEFETLIRGGGSHDQWNSTPLSSSSFNFSMQSQSRDSELAIVDRGGDLMTNPLIVNHISGVPNPDGLESTIQSEIEELLQINDAADISEPNPINQPLSQYSPQMVPENQRWIASFQPLGGTLRRAFDGSHRSSGLEILQPQAQPQPELFCAESLSFYQTPFSQTSDSSVWDPNNGYPSTERGPTVGWPYFSENFEYDATAGC